MQRLGVIIIAETIRGISVVIGSDTTGLSKALSDVNKNARDIQGELKQVEKLLKLDPSNTELLSQKQKLLGDAVANTGEKLNRLKTAQEQVNQQFAEGKISEGQYRAFQREIAATEQSLKRFEQQASGTKKTLADIGKAAQDAGEKMKGAGEKMSVGITAPIVAAGGIMLKGAIDAENATGKLQAALGLTTDEAADLSAVAEALWVNGFGENIGEATKAIQQVRSNMGVLAEDELQLVAEGAMTIADVFDQDVNEVTRAAGVAMKNFGISGQEAMDVLTVGFQRGGDYSGELLDTVREYSPQFASLGLTADQAMGMLIAGAQAGAWNLDKVGDSMKEFNIRAQDGSKTTADGFAAIGLNAQEMGSSIAKGGEDAQKAFMATIAALASMKDPMAQNQAGVALFGTQWEDVRSQVIIAMAEGVKGLGEFQGATEAAAKAAYENNPGLALTMSMRELSSAIGPALLPLADIIKNSIVPAVKSLAEGFANLSPEGQKVVLAIAGIAATIGPVLIALGFLASSIGSIIGLYATWTASAAATAAGTATVGATSAAATPAVTGLGAAFKFLLGPIGLAIAAIAAVAAAGILLYKNWDTITAKAKELWAKLGETWKSIESATSETWKNITGSLSKTWDGIKATASKTWESIKEFFKKWGADLLLIATGPAGWSVLLAKNLAQNWEAIKQTALNVWTNIKTGISNIWNGITGAITGAIGNVTSTVRSGLENTWNYIKSIPNQAIQWGRNIIQGLINGIKSLHIPMPHFDFSVGWRSVAGANFPVPRVDVDWYAKGGIFTSPQVAGIGDVPEAVMPLAKLPALMTEALIGAAQRLSSPAQPAAAVAGVGAVTNSYSFSFTGPISIRNDQDIERVAQRIQQLNQSKLRGQGK